MNVLGLPDHSIHRRVEAMVIHRRETKDGEGATFKIRGHGVVHQQAGEVEVLSLLRGVAGERCL